MIKLPFGEPILISTNKNHLDNYVGFYSISADVGIGILPIEQTVENVNVCVSEFLVGNVPTKRRKTKVHYAPNGRAYITRLGENYFIDEFIRLR